MHSNVRVLATAYQPDFCNPTLELNIYPRGIRGMRQRGYVYKLRETKRTLTADGILELEYDTIWAHDNDVTVRPDVIRQFTRFDVGEHDNQIRKVKRVRLKLVGALEREMEIPVLAKRPITGRGPRRSGWNRRT